MANGRSIQTIGSATAAKSPCAIGAHNFRRNYFYHLGSGDVRALYEDLYFNGASGGGEVIRVRGIANVASAATGATINGIHATGRVASGKSVSGALNAIRATLEVAGTTPSPGGTLSALQVDTNISTGWTEPAASFIRFTNTGAGKVTNLFEVPTAAAKTAYLTDPFVARHADATATHGIKIRDAAGTAYWIMVTTDTPND